MRIAMTGASGSGKTTLATFVQEQFPELKFLSNSAYDVITEEDRAFLNREYGYIAKGQANVIAMSHSNPNFGFDFQDILLRNRINLYKGNDNFVTDRSFIDNIAYYLDQCCAYQTEATTIAFISRAIEAMSNIDLIIRINMTQPLAHGVENNDSRVANWFYQKKIDKVFDLATELVNHNNSGLLFPPIKILVLDKWDLKDRKTKVFQTINELYESKKTC